MAEPGNPHPTESYPVQQRRRELLSIYKTINGELADLNWTLAELEQQIATLAAESSDATHPEARLRLLDLRRWQGALEERILGHLYQIDEVLAALEQLQAGRHRSE
jgi:hypothetical protein